MRKPRIPYFVCLGVILLLLGIWASFDEPYTTLDGITDKETIKKISNCEKSKFGSNYENIILTGNYDIDWSNCDLSNVVLRYTQLNNANVVFSQTSFNSWMAAGAFIPHHIERLTLLYTAILMLKWSMTPGHPGFLILLNLLNRKFLCKQLRIALSVSTGS